MRRNWTRLLVPETVILAIILVIVLGIVASVQGPAFTLAYLIVGIGLLSLFAGMAAYIRGRNRVPSQ
ncbi:MAG: hypothetical protein KKA73_02810 [Chloroflexi bacterium]|nr:hypothetical protein [Chloroflexota bacterium]MBU1746595.1 hypothetical protein [Chloroflexota bacterium]